MNIFYKYGNVSDQELQPIKGDLINEISFINVLKKFATVDYDGKQSGQDIYFIRGNAELFLKLPHPKIWVAAPFVRQCYEQADMIATFSEAWAEGIRNGNDFSWIKAEDKKPFPQAINISQAVEDSFMPLSKHPTTLEIRKQFGGKFVIGHFGRIVEGSYPAAFLRILPQLKKMGVVFICASTPTQKNFVAGNAPESYAKLIRKYKVSITNWKRFDSFKRWEFPHEEMPFAISACDLICIYGQAGEGVWDVCGSRGVLEAAACGVPIICGDSPARRDFMGADYSLFHSGFNKNGENVVSKYYWNSLSNKRDSDELFNLIKIVINGGDMLREKIGRDLVKRANKFKPTKLSERIKPIFEKLIQG